MSLQLKAQNTAVFLSEHEPRFKKLFRLPLLPPPETSTPLKQLSMCEVASSEVLAVQTEMECAHEDVYEEESLQPVDTEGLANMAVGDVSQEAQSVLQTPLQGCCKASWRLQGAL